MVPDQPTADGAEVSRQARDFLLHRWQGRTMMAIGAQDPVLGVPVMEALRAQIRGCPAPLVLPQAGHFVQEHGEAIAREAVGYFRP
jgi:tRNA(adenine34) deaminase